MIPQCQDFGSVVGESTLDIQVIALYNNVIYTHEITKYRLFQGKIKPTVAITNFMVRLQDKSTTEMMVD